jgi:hypothetical protein
MVARPGQSLLRHTPDSSSNVSAKPRLTPAIFIHPKNAGWLVRDLSTSKTLVVTRHLHIIDDPTLLPARLAASDDMYKRFGLPPGQSGVHHKAVRDLYASNPLADLDLSFLVSGPLTGVAIRLTAAVDDEGNPTYAREASLELRQAGEHAPIQSAAGAVVRAKPLADHLKTNGLSPRLLSELNELQPSVSAPGRPSAKPSHKSTTLAAIKLKGLSSTTALGFDQRHTLLPQRLQLRPRARSRVAPEHGQPSRVHSGGRSYRQACQCCEPSHSGRRREFCNSTTPRGDGVAQRGPECTFRYIDKPRRLVPRTLPTDAGPRRRR